MAGFTSTVLAVTAIAGLAASVGGQVMAGQAQAAQGRQMAAQENLNAMIGRQNAAAIGQAGAFEEEKQRRENARLIGRQRALVAKSGVRFSGSPLDVMSDTIADQELDIAAMNYNTEIARRRALSGADYSDFLGSSYKKQGQIASNESMFKAGTTLLTTGASIANKYGGAFKYNSSVGGMSSPYALIGTRG